MYLYALTCSSAIGGFLFGYDTGVISGALVLLENPDQFDLTPVQSEAVVSATIFGAILGAMNGEWLNRRFGRRGVIILSSAIFTLGAALMGWAFSYSTLMFGRFIVGIAVGLASMTVPMYIAEVAPPEYRGTLVSLNTLFITGGQFVASLVGGVFSTVDGGWRYMLGLSAVPSILQFIAFMFLPESPRWLINRNRQDEALVVLRKIRDSDHVVDEIKMIVEDLTRTEKVSGGSWRDLQVKSVRRALVLGCMLQALQQLSGINTVMYYSATIIQMAGFHDDSQAIWLSSIVAFSNFAFTILGLYLVERAGRRRLTLYSLAGVALALGLLGTGFYMAEVNSPRTTGLGVCSVYDTCFDCVADNHCGYCPTTSTLNLPGFCFPGNASSPTSGSCSRETWHFSHCPGSSSASGWFILLALFIYLAAFAPGMGPMPWTINSEIYPLHVRSRCVGLATSVNWLCNLLVAFTFLSITRAFTTYGAFWLYAVIAFAGWIFLYKALPETKGRGLEEIQQLFGHRN